MTEDTCINYTTGYLLKGKILEREDFDCYLSVLNPLVFSPLKIALCIQHCVFC